MSFAQQEHLAQGGNVGRITADRAVAAVEVVAAIEQITGTHRIAGSELAVRAGYKVIPVERSRKRANQAAGFHIGAAVDRRQTGVAIDSGIAGAESVRAEF